MERNKARLAADCVRAGKKVERRLDVTARYLAKYYKGNDLDITAAVCAEACGDRSEMSGLLEALFARESRDGRSLAAAVELAEELAQQGHETAGALLGAFWLESAEYGLDSTEDMVVVEGGAFPYQGGAGIEVAPFWIGKHPVTNGDYERMVPAHRRERDKSSDRDDQPKVYVNWREAQLYCRWRGKGFRLPMEEEWEKAASWDPEAGTKRVYPWKGEFDSTLCNTGESGINKTTPVGRYPNGASAYGCEDMAGNVWEWCLNEYRNAERVDGESGGPRALRGGSWYSDQVGARAVVRGGIDPEFREVHFGFRVVCSSPIR